MIPFHVNDAHTLLVNGGLQSIKKHVQGLRKVFIVAHKDCRKVLDGFLDDNTIFFDEGLLPFNTTSFNGQGWVFQQAIKLLGPSSIRDMSETFVVLDADVVLVKDINFISISSLNSIRQLQYVYAHAQPDGSIPTDTYGLNYLLGKDVPGPVCAVHHHMVMQKEVLHHMVAEISQTHVGHDLPSLFSEASQHGYLSEYILYFWFMLEHYRHEMNIVFLPYVGAHNSADCGLEAQQAYNQSDVVYIICHDHYHEAYDLCVNSKDGCSTFLNIGTPKVSSWGLCTHLPRASHQGLTRKHGTNHEP